MVDAIAGVVTLLVVGIFGYGLPIRLGLREARSKGVSPHWLWFGIYPFVGWLVWAIIRRRSEPALCPSCKAQLRSGDRYSPGCRLPVSDAGVAVAQGIQWSRGAVACGKCHAPVKLTDSICTNCGTPPPAVGCPQCGSPRTSLVSRRRMLLVSGIAFMAGGSIPLNQLDKRPAYAASAALTVGDVITIAAALAVFALGVLAVYQAFTWRAFLVRCDDCGKRSKPGAAPALHFQTDGPAASSG